ncbi:hypothetical protein MVEN_02049900 [Mycena venus]|uniref:Uncharacterized protein n=1 Tax=Mycena venus TaxID=2733690 RepID=A0A8H7CJ75_9AGAR|nr:hypothetical protein MVEN_02049900 [Mycena venus]
MPCLPVARTFAARTRATRRFSALPKLKPVQANDTLHLLEATAALVPDALADDPGQLSHWNNVLSTVLVDVRSYHPRPARLVVCGTEGTGARDLVTALLEEPFMSNAQKSLLRARWVDTPPEKTSLTIEYGGPATQDIPAAEDSLRLPLAYLNRTPPLQIIESADPALLQTADVPVIVTSLDELPTLNITRPDSLVVLNIDNTDAQPRASTSRSPAAPAKYLFISPSQALSGLDAMRDQPKALRDTAKEYQQLFIASQMHTLFSALNDILSSVQSTSALRNRTALAHVRGALAACRAAIQDSRAELDRVATGVSDLSALAEEERVKVQRDVFGSPDDHAVDRALVDATAMMKMKIDHMYWRRSIFTIDELTTYLTSTVQRIWCLGLEKELTFHSGRLANMQREVTARAFEFLAPSNTRALHSPILDNALRQLTTAPMILGAPTARLHVAAQRAMFGLGGACATGMAISWSGYFGFMINAHALGGPLMLEPGTAVATGMLIALLGVHWSARKWNKARERWWDDFMRVAGGVKQDITDTLDQTMQNQVLVVARTGCAELSKKLGERKTELDRLQERLDALSLAADQLEQRK